MEEKQSLYDALVCERKQCRLCIGLRNPAEPKLNLFDSNEIGPWSRLHGNLNADLMIVGQDWGDVAYFIRNEGFDDLKNRTMQTLERLLRGVGLRISLSAYNTKPIGIRLFLTNAILCLKKGGMTASVDDRWAKNCRTRFLRKQIEIIQPRVVVALGQVAYKSVAMGFDLRAPAGPYRPIVEDKKGIVLSNGSRLFGVYHCAPGVINRTRCFSEQLRDWRRVAKALRE